MADDQKPQPVGSRPYSPRIEVHEEARLIDGEGTTHDVILADISREGFRIKCDSAIVAPGSATLRVERYGDMPVEIRWIRGREAGGIFLDSAPEL